MTSRQLIPLALTLALGCAHKQEQKTEPPPPAPEPAKPAAAEPAPTNASAKACINDTDCADGELCSQKVCVPINASMAECGLVRVQFAFDSSEIAQDDRPLLERGARCLRRDHKLHVLIEGNADERGTEEYNLALGDRRATSVAKFMKTLGVSDAQLGTISYGKEKPLCTEHDEACWSKNRRAAVRPSDHK
jgi:peptidoglycan-associated lipoprotein